MTESTTLEKTEIEQELKKPSIDVTQVTTEKRKRGRPAGYKVSKATREKISASNLGKKKTRRKV